jgi:hypothetical protein
LQFLACSTSKGGRLEEPLRRDAFRRTYFSADRLPRRPAPGGILAHTAALDKKRQEQVKPNLRGGVSITVPRGLRPGFAAIRH